MRVALADDSALFRQGLGALLAAADIEVLFEARTGTELLARLDREEIPDAVILDIRMPPTFTDEGLVTARELKARHPKVGVLVLSTYAETHYADRLVGDGQSGVGYLLKDRVEDIATLRDGLERVRAGGIVVDPGLVTMLLQSRAHRDVLDGLSARERDVLREMAQGRSNAGIGKVLHLSPKTVETHVAGVFGKLGVPAGSDSNRRVLAVLSWLRRGGDVRA